MRRNNDDKKNMTSNALEIIDQHYIKNDPEAEAILEEERANLDVACKIYDLRQEAGLTQQELADLIGTSRSTITRLEDADYEGHSLSMLRRIAAALNKKVQIEFVPLTSHTEYSDSHSARSYVTKDES